MWSAIVGILLLSVSEASAQIYTQPEQIHISYGVQPSEMMISWVTFDPTDSSIVEYGRHELDSYAKGFSKVFTDGGHLQRKLYIHSVTLTQLIPGAMYNYHCGSSYGWSSIYSFRAMPEGTEWSPRLAVFGDLGNVNAQSLPRLQKETQAGLYDAILHVGDFAYDLDSDNAQVGDAFMRQIEPIAAYVPYMTCVGNHEHAYWNVGPAHIIAFSTEFYFYVQYGWTQIMEQFKWLEKDLIEANKPENRAVRPWIITMGHRPMYCSNVGNDDCTKSESIIRTGIPVINAFGLEDLFYKYGVDLELWAHEHSYERLWPVYNKTVYKGSDEEPYTNPKAPVHIITGSAGCQERITEFKPPKPWDAFRSTDYGYTRLMIINGSHLYLEQVSDDQDGAIVDRVSIIKEKHGFEAWL